MLSCWKVTHWYGCCAFKGYGWKVMSRFHMAEWMMRKKLDMTIGRLFLDIVSRILHGSRTSSCFWSSCALTPYSVFLNAFSCVFPTVTTLLNILCHLISMVVFLFIFVYENAKGILFCMCNHFCTTSRFISPTFLVVCLYSYLRFRCYSFLFTFLTISRNFILLFMQDYQSLLS
jgi:hypothetical protein